MLCCCGDRVKEESVAGRWWLPTWAPARPWKCRTRKLLPRPLPCEPKGKSTPSFPARLSSSFCKVMLLSPSHRDSTDTSPAGGLAGPVRSAPSRGAGPPSPWELSNDSGSLAPRHLVGEGSFPFFFYSSFITRL